MKAGDTEFQARVRIDTPREQQYFRHGGILPFVLRSLLEGLSPAALARRSGAGLGSRRSRSPSLVVAILATARAAPRWPPSRAAAVATRTA